MNNENISTVTNPTANLEFISRLNVMLASDHDYRKNIDNALKMIGHYIHNDRIHIIEIHHNMTISILHEWCNQHISPVKDKVKQRKFIFNKDLEEQLYTQDYITLNSSEDSVNNEIKELLNGHGCKSTIMFPLFETGDQLAFIAFTQSDEKYSWSNDEIRLMTTLSSIVAGNLDKNLLVSKLIYHLTQNQKQNKEAAFLQSQIQMLSDNLLLAWDELKQNLENSELKTQIPDINILDGHVQSFNKLCQRMAVK